MFKWLSKAISHPLIAGIIGAVIAGLILFKLTTHGDIVWPVGIVDGFHSLLAWIAEIAGGLIAPVPVPRVLLYILIGVAVVSVLSIVGSRLSGSTEEIIKAAGKLLPLTAGPTKEPLPTDELPAIVTGKRAPLPLPSDLSDRQRRLLYFLSREYPRSLGLSMICGPLAQPYIETEQMCEKLQDMRLVEITPAGYNAPTVFLTKTGRYYCVQHGLNQHDPGLGATSR